MLDPHPMVRSSADAAASAKNDDTAAPSLFTAIQEQVGLKLDAVKVHGHDCHRSCRKHLPRISSANLFTQKLPPYAVGSFLFVHAQELLALPADAVLAVLDHDALGQQVVADGVGAGEVAGLLGLGALGDEGVDVGVGEG